MYVIKKRKYYGNRDFYPNDGDSFVCRIVDQRKRCKLHFHSRLSSEVLIVAKHAANRICTCEKN